MKILYCAMKYDYGAPARGGYSLEHYNFYESLRRYQNHRHEIFYFPFDEIMREVGQDEMNRRLLAAVRDHKPDFCFFVLFKDEITKATLAKLKQKTSTITYNWFCDDHWRFHNFSKHYAPLFHFISTTDSQAPAKYRAIGYTNVIKTQWACSPAVYKPYPVLKTYTASFLGQPYGDRPRLIAALTKAGIPVTCYGPGWPAGRVWGEEMVKKFSASKINLNFAKSSGRDWKGLAKVFLNKTAGCYRLNPISSWLDELRSYRDRVVIKQIKTRNFEVPGSGGFLLTDAADNVDEYYTDGKEIVIFKNISDLIEKARYYASHDAEREAIAKAGYERTLREHTYEKRFDDIFKAAGMSKS